MRPPPAVERPWLVTAAIDHDAIAGSPLAPVTATLQAIFGTSTELPGLAPDLLVHDTTVAGPAP